MNAPPPPAAGSAFQQFATTNKYVDATRDFLESNSLVARFAFLLLVLFAFVILLRAGIGLLGYLLGPSDSPRLIDGMVDAKQMLVIPQDPATRGAVTITRSVNEDQGIEFTWSVWIYIDDLTYKQGQYRCVFYKGNDFQSQANTSNTNKQRGETAEAYGLNFPNNAPGVYLAPNTNKLVVLMNTFSVINEEITVDDVPLNKWVHVLLRCEQNTMDVYINGTIYKSHQLHGVPKQNYGDVYVAPGGGFAGYISNLWYYNRALSIGEIARLANRGPNTYMQGSSAMTMKRPDYLSLRWFLGDVPTAPPVV